ncbi:aminodeoxychorismate synthase component I [Leptolyngbya sp. AN02str]|uniref:aminodeoxychorismate synthase component I n=1 Tax=Leptolyngbya sp. AN02str TaxID=3423363 RepID=UPI003D31D88A
MLLSDSSPRLILYDARQRCWLLFRQPRQILMAHSLSEVVPMLAEVQQQVEQGHYAAGFVTYEAAPAFDSALEVRSPASSSPVPLLWFGLFNAPEVIDIAASPQPLTLLQWQPTISDAEYSAALRTVKECIRRGDTYQVNYTFRLRASFAGDAWALFQQMIAAQGNGYGAFVQGDRFTICSASPELFFEQRGQELISRPMKGTAARGVGPGDRHQADWLHHSEKNRAENVMIVDMMRNDMNRIAHVGSVQTTSLFDVEQYPTLWQMTSTVRCTTDAGLVELFQGLFPAASITGAPKARTMQIIAQLETTPRHIYTGTIGYVAPGAIAQFNVAIRTVLLDHGAQTAEYGLGSGIVWDSETGTEFEECLTKAKILF